MAEFHNWLMAEDLEVVECNATASGLLKFRLQDHDGLQVDTSFNKGELNNSESELALLSVLLRAHRRTGEAATEQETAGDETTEHRDSAEH